MANSDVDTLKNRVLVAQMACFFEKVSHVVFLTSQNIYYYVVTLVV